MFEKALEFRSNEELLGRTILNDIAPDDLLLAVGGEGLVLWSIQVIFDFQLWAPSVLLTITLLLLRRLRSLVTIALWSLM